MGMVSTEQTVAIIDSVARVYPEQELTNYWWLLILAIIPVILGWWLTKGKK